MDQMIFTKEQKTLIFEFAEWLEEFALAKCGGISKPYRYSWSVPRLTKEGQWYSNWTTEALWDKFLEEKENAKGQDL